LILRQIIVGLYPLKPDARFNLVNPVQDGDMIVVGEQVAHRCQIASGIRSGEADLRRSVQRGAAADDQRADRVAFYPAWNIHGRVAGEEITGAGESDPRGIQEPRRKNVLLLQAGDLLPKRLYDTAQRVHRRSIVGAVIHRVNPKQRVFVR